MRNPVIPEEVGKKMLLVCMICNKKIQGFYSRHGDKGTCSKACMKMQDSKPKYPGFEESDYFRRQGETMDSDPDILNQGE